MGRQLFVILIDDRHEASREAIKLLEPYATICTVRGIQETIDELRNIQTLVHGDGIVDIILCDINLEYDRTLKGFSLELNSGRAPVKPSFEIRGLEGDAKDIEQLEGANGQRSFMPY